MSITKQAFYRGALEFTSGTSFPLEPRAASVYRYFFAGAGTATLPDATELIGGEEVWIWNDSASDTLTVKDDAAGTVGTVALQTGAVVHLFDNSTAAGTWRLRPLSVAVA
jgi:hypothetical protein